MKKLFSILFCCGLAAAAQTTFTLTGPAAARPGATVTVTLAAAGATNTGAAGLQWTLLYPAGVTGYTQTATAGATVTAAGKAIACTTDSLTCLAIGMNANTIGNGAAAVYSIKIPSTAAAGALTLKTSPAIAVSPTGAPLSTAGGPDYVLTILAKQDLNGDGKVDASDVQLMVSEVLASQTNPAACVDDMNGDGKCDVIDVFNVVMKALGI